MRRTLHGQTPVHLWLGAMLVVAHLLAVQAQSPNDAVLEDNNVVPPPPPPLNDTACDSAVPTAWWHLIHAPTFYWWAVRRPRAHIQHPNCHDPGDAALCEALDQAPKAQPHTHNRRWWSAGPPGGHLIQTSSPLTPGGAVGAGVGGGRPVQRPVVLLNTALVATMSHSHRRAIREAGRRAAEGNDLLYPPTQYGCVSREPRTSRHHGRCCLLATPLSS